MARKKRVEYPIEVIETEQGIGFGIDFRIKPQWKPPRKFKSVTLGEFALEADSYPLVGYEIPQGQRVIAMGSGIYGMDGKLFQSGSYTHKEFGKIFLPLMEVIKRYNVVLDAVMSYNPHFDQTDLIICDCFLGQDWNCSKVVLPIGLRIQNVHRVINESTQYFQELSTYVPQKINLNFRSVCHIWFSTIKDVTLEYKSLLNKKEATGLALIDARYLHPSDVFITGTRTVFNFTDDERCWKILVMPEPQVKPKRKYIRRNKKDDDT
jgi:hypothetical protein